MTVDFGVVRAIDAQAFGQPGERTFRLRMVSDDGQTASVWLEKEQMQALSLALKQMLAQLEYEDEPPAADVGEFPATADHDFRVGRLGMGFDPSDRTIVLYSYEMGAAEDDEDPLLRVRITQEQSASLGVRLDEIVASGRPICPLCGVPMDSSGHVCIRANGHTKQPIPEPENDTDENASGQE